MVYQIQTHTPFGWKKYPSGRNSTLRRTNFKKKRMADSYFRALKAHRRQMGLSESDVRLVRYTRHKSTRTRRSR